MKSSKNQQLSGSSVLEFRVKFLLEGHFNLATAFNEFVSIAPVRDFELESKDPDQGIGDRRKRAAEFPEAFYSTRVSGARNFTGVDLEDALKEVVCALLPARLQLLNFVEKYKDHFRFTLAVLIELRSRSSHIGNLSPNLLMGISELFEVLVVDAVDLTPFDELLDSGVETRSCQPIEFVTDESVFTVPNQDCTELCARLFQAIESEAIPASPARTDVCSFRIGLLENEFGCVLGSATLEKLARERISLDLHYCWD